MILPIVLFILEILSILFSVIFYAVNPNSINSNPHVLMIGISYFASLLSLPSFFWNFNNVKNCISKFVKTRGVIGILFSIATFVIAIAVLVIVFVRRAAENGLRVF